MRRDDPDVYQVGPPEALPAEPETVIAALSPLVTEARLERIRQVVEARTTAVIPVLDGLTDPHNGSAVLRSADAFGLQEVHVVDGPHGFMAAHRVAKGTHRWLDVRRWDDATTCVEALHGRGYEVYVAAMGGAHRPEDLRARERVAVVFGNEHAGVRPELAEAADGTLAIPMRGFVESLNVSVAAAVTLYTATAGRPGDLPPRERNRLLARFLLQSVRDAERIVRDHVG